MGFRTLAVALVTAVLATLVVHEAFAQLLQARGRVTDEWGNPLEGVQVEAMREGGGGSNRSSITDEVNRVPPVAREQKKGSEICRDIPGYSGMRPRRLRPMIVGGATACWCGLRGDRPTKLWIKTFDPSNGLQTSVSGGFGVVEIGGYFGGVSHDG